MPCMKHLTVFATCVLLCLPVPGTALAQPALSAGEPTH